MIRLKNRVYPVWISWEGKEEDFEMAKASIIQDIVNSGFSHYDAYVDVVEDASGDKDWDGKPREVPVPTQEEMIANMGGSDTQQAVNPPSKPTYETRGKVTSGGPETPTKSTKKTASK
tara:strand:- start:149 stop:502 length:354 start_codon:yes stop_codon:yes gene_type:complete